MEVCSKQFHQIFLNNSCCLISAQYNIELHMDPLRSLSSKLPSPIANQCHQCSHMTRTFLLHLLLMMIM